MKRPLISAIASVIGICLIGVALAALGSSAGASTGPVRTDLGAAIPTGGADPDTPGTSSSVSPRRLVAGTTINYTVRGFPGGEVLNIKIDDGLFCSQSGTHGACVVAQQRIPASGVVSGSLVVPSDLRAGKHWLRFLASEELYDADGNYQGIKGYTLRGGADFTVVAASADPGSDPGTPEGDPGTPGVGPSVAPQPGTSADPSVPSDGGSTSVPEPGAVLTAAPPSVAPGTVEPEQSTDEAAEAPQPETTAVSATTAGQEQRVVTQSPNAKVPIVGLLGLLLLLGASAAVTLQRRRG